MGKFSQGHASDHPKIWPVRIPKKEALNSRLINWKHLLGELTYRGLQQSSLQTERKAVFYLSICPKHGDQDMQFISGFKEFGSELGLVSFSVFGNILDTSISAWEYSKLLFVFKPPRENLKLCGSQSGPGSLSFAIRIQKETGKEEELGDSTKLKRKEHFLTNSTRPALF